MIETILLLIAFIFWRVFNIVVVTKVILLIIVIKLIVGLKW